MKLLEYEGKSVFAQNGIPIPKGFFVKDLAEAARALDELGGEAVLKSQVLSGGRGKAGGIRIVDKGNLTDAWKAIRELPINGEYPRGFLLEEKLDVYREVYIGFTIDSSGVPFFMGSAQGGIDIEVIVDSKTTRVYKKTIDPLETLRPFHALNMGVEMGLAGEELVRVASIIQKLYQLFIKCDCEMAEINPLVITSQGVVLAADSKMIINDDALFRQKDIEQLLVKSETKQGPELEEKARQNNIHFVDLKGDVAVLGLGAGVTMTVLDIISHAGGRPANFIDTKGGATRDTVEKMTELVLEKIQMDNDIKCLVVNIVLAATQLSSLVNGIAGVIKQKGCRVPIVAIVHAADAALREMTLAEARELFADAGIEILPQFKELHLYIRNLILGRTA